MSIPRAGCATYPPKSARQRPCSSASLRPHARRPAAIPSTRRRDTPRRTPPRVTVSARSLTAASRHGAPMEDIMTIALKPPTLLHVTALAVLVLISSCKVATPDPRTELARSLKGANVEGYQFGVKEDDAFVVTSLTNGAVRDVMKLGDEASRTPLQYTRVLDKKSKAENLYRTDVVRDIPGTGGHRHSERCRSKQEAISRAGQDATASASIRFRLPAAVHLGFPLRTRRTTSMRGEPNLPGPTGGLVPAVSRAATATACTW